MDQQQFQERYNALRLQGLSHDDAVARLRGGVAAQAPATPTRTTAPASPAVATRPTATQAARPDAPSRGAVQEFGRGAALGLTEAGTSLAQGVGWLGRKAAELVPGEGPVERAFRGLESGAERFESGAERFFDPRGAAGTAGRLLGRIGGEVATTVATLGAGKVAAARYAPSALDAARRTIGASRARSALAAMGAEAVPSTVRAAGEAAEGRSFIGELGLELGGAGIGGALVPLGRASQEVTGGLFGEVPSLSVSKQLDEVLPQQREGVRGAYQSFKDRLNRGVYVLRREFVDKTLPLVKAMSRDVGEVEARRLNQLISQQNAAGRMAVDEFKDRFGEVIEKGDDYMDTLSQYAIVRREAALRAKRPQMRKLVNRDTNKPFTDDELTKILEEGRNIPGLEEDAQKLNDFFRDLLELQLEKGLISRKSYDRIVQSQDFYVPFQRSFGEAAAGGQRWFNRQFGPTGRVAKMDEGSIPDLDIQNPLIVAAQEAQAVFDAAAKQDIVNMFASLERTGAFRASGLIERVPSGYKPKPNDRIVAGTVNGRRMRYRIADPEVYEAMVSQAAPSNNLLFRIARGMTTLKRNTITALPGFAALSIARDIPQYALQRRDIGRALTESAIGAGVGAAVGGVAGGDIESAISGGLVGSGAGILARPAGQVGRAAGLVASETRVGREAVRATERIATSIAKAVGIEDADVKLFSPKSREIMDLWARSGGITESFYAKGTEDARKLIQGIQRNNQPLAKSIVSPMSWWETLQAIGRVAERAPRLAEFRRALEAGESVPEAVFKSHDVTLNFARRGITGGTIAPYTAFFNAKMQGWDKLGRMMSDKDTYKLGIPMLLAPTIGLWMLNKDNPDYWDRPEWEKNLFWLIPDPSQEGGFTRIPKPFEIGTAFASSFERMFDALARGGAIETRAAPKNPDTSIPGYLEDMVRAVGAYAGESALVFPDVLTPVVQQVAGRDFFRGRDIVPTAQRQFPRASQYTEQTGALPRMVGEALNVSPLRVEQLISDVAGTAGRRLQDVVIDPAARALGLPAPVEEEPGRGIVSRALEAVGARRFRTREYSVGQIEYDAQKRIDRLQGKRMQLNKLVADGEPMEKIRSFYEKNREDLQSLASLDEARIALDRINRTRRAISRNRQLTPEQRKERMDALNERARQIATIVLESGAEK